MQLTNGTFFKGREWPSSGVLNPSIAIDRSIAATSQVDLHLFFNFFFESSVNRFPSEPLESLVNEPTH
jgi:hypothetical protein